MMASVSFDPTNLVDVQSALAHLRAIESRLDGGNNEESTLQEILDLDSGRLVRLAYEHFGTDPFDLHQLADASGEGVRQLHGTTGSLGRACDSRGVEVFNRLGGSPQRLSVRPEVASILARNGQN